MPRGRAGFTLLETMVALAVLGLAVVAMLRALGDSTDATDRVRRYTAALALAEAEMERLVAARPGEVLRADGRTGRFRPPFEGYRYAVSAGRVPGRDLVEIRLHVAWGAEGSAGGGLDLATRRAIAPGELER